MRKEKVVKKKNKLILSRIFSLVFMTMFIISLFMDIKVLAEVNPFNLTNATIEEKSDTVTGTITSFNNNEIINNIVFHKLNDYVVYKLEIQSNLEKEITILEITDDNSNEYIDYEYDKHENDKVSRGLPINFLVKAIYKNELTDTSKRNQTNNIKFNITYLEDGKVKEDTITINPKTGDGISKSFILLLISGIGLITCISLDKKRKSKKLPKVFSFIITGLVLTPIIVKAKTFNSSILLVSNYGLYDKVVVTIDDKVNELATQIIDYNSKLDSLPDTTVEGYTLSKWLVNDNEFNIKENIIEDITIEAEYTPNSYSIIFNKNANNATGNIPNKAMIYDQADTLPNNTFERVGYKFDSWNTKADGTGTKYNNKAEVKNLATSDEVTLYAIWEETSTFDIGQNINIKMKQLSGQTSTSATSSNSKITAIKQSNTISDEYKTDNNIVSTNDSNNPIYMWFDNGTIYYYSESTILYLNSNSSYIFSGLSKLSDISGLSNWDTSKVTNMGYMFRNCSSLTDLSGLSNWDTSKVTTMYSMFNGCSNLTNISALSSWNISSVTAMNFMFNGCSNLTNISALSSWDTSKVTNMSNMFYGCSGLINLSGLSNWDTSKVTNMSNMFYGCRNLTNISALGSWDTSKVTNMSDMFNGCSNLTNISALSSWNISSVTDMNFMFNDCSNLTNISALSSWNISSVTAMISMFNGCSGLINLSGLSNWDTSKVTNMSYMFRNCSSLTDLSGLSNWDTSKVTTMNSMFNGCRNLTNISALGSWDTSNVDNMSYMFYGCSGLTDLSALSSWNISSVTDMIFMFYGCSNLTNISALSSWDTSKVTTMSYVFKNCSKLTDASPLNNWNIEKVGSFSSMLQGCSSLTIYPNWDGTWNYGTFIKN